MNDPVTIPPEVTTKRLIEVRRFFTNLMKQVYITSMVGVPQPLPCPCITHALRKHQA